MKPPLVRSLGLELQNVTPRKRMAAVIVLGLECDHIKKTNGYMGGGNWWSFKNELKDGTRRTWPQLLSEEADISDRTAQNYLEAAEAVKLRSEYSSDPEKTDLYWCMKIPPSELTHAQRQSLIERIARLGLTEGDTLAYLIREYRAAQGKAPTQATRKGSAVPTPCPHEQVEDPELRKLLRVRDVMAEECKRRTLQRANQLAKYPERSGSMTAEVVSLVLRALKQSKRTN